MKILHLATHLEIGGITSWLDLAGGELARRGHRVGALTSGGAREAALTARGLTVHRLRRLRTKNEFDPRLLLLALPRALDIVRGNGYEVLHAHTRVTQVLAKAVSALSGVPFVSTAHGFFRPRLSRRLVDAWGRRVIAISPFVASELERVHRVDPGRIRLVPNAIDGEGLRRRTAAVSGTDARALLGLPPEARVVGSISRLVRDKGHEHLARAAALLIPERPDLHLLIVGDGPERDRLEKLLGDGPLKGRARLVRAVPDVATALAAIDIFVHPATYREGFGLSIAEAMAVGRPVVATRIPALDTLLTDGRDALLVPPGDPEALAAALRGLLADPALAARIAAGGRLRADEVSSPERMAAALENVYREVLSGP